MSDLKDKLFFEKLQKDGRFICGYEPCEGEKCPLWKYCVQPQRALLAKEKVEFT
jgi:hypothetical protein